MNRQQLLDLYYLEARSKSLVNALPELQRADASRAEHVLKSLSDPTSEPIAAATTKAACGAWPGKAS